MIVKLTVAKKEKRILEITTENIRLDSALKLCNAVSTGGQAKMIIMDGLVKVGGVVCNMRGKKLYDGDEFEYQRVCYVIRRKV